MRSPHVRLQNAMRNLATKQCKQERAEKHLAEAQAGYQRAVDEVSEAKKDLEQAQALLAPCAPMAASSAPLSSDFYDELDNVKAAAQWDQSGNVVVPYTMLQGLFSHVPPRNPRPHPDAGDATPKTSDEVMADISKDAAVKDLLDDLGEAQLRQALQNMIAAGATRAARPPASIPIASSTEASVEGDVPKPKPKFRRLSGKTTVDLNTGYRMVIQKGRRARKGKKLS